MIHLAMTVSFQTEYAVYQIKVQSSCEHTRTPKVRES